ncbi:MAG: zinc-ribbon domain-containing protein [Candidatus Hodarchaeota archaeon]
MSDYKFCSQCGGRVKRTAKFCGHCGKPMQSKTSTPHLEEIKEKESVVMSLDTFKEEEKQEEKKICPTCNAENDQDSVFCKKCAALL